MKRIILFAFGTIGLISLTHAGFVLFTLTETSNEVRLPQRGEALAEAVKSMKERASGHSVSYLGDFLGTEGEALEFYKDNSIQTKYKFPDVELGISPSGNLVYCVSKNGLPPRELKKAIWSTISGLTSLCGILAILFFEGKAERRDRVGTRFST